MNLPFAKLLSSAPGTDSRPLRALGAAAIAVWALAACAQTPSRNATANSPLSSSQAQADNQAAAATRLAAARKAAAAEQAAEDAKLPKIPVTSQIVFQVLAAEIALQRGQPAPAYQTYLALARETHDPRAAQRAAEIALRAQSPDDALAAAQLWRQYAPYDVRAGQLDASLLVMSGKPEQAQALLSDQLAKVTPAERPDAILSLQLLLSRGPDRIGGLHVLQDLLKNDMQTPEANLAIARQQINADDQPGARKSLHTALQLRPGYEPAALLLGQLGPEERKQAIAALNQAIAKDPKDHAARLALAQLLLADNQLDAANRQFVIMRAQDPNDLTPLMAMALIQIQKKDYEHAKVTLQTFAAQAEKQGPLSGADPGQAYLYLAQISIEQNDEAGAEGWLSKVPQTSNQYAAAQIAEAQLYAKQGKYDQARGLLAGLHSADPRDQSLIIRTDAAVLVQAKRYDEAETRLADANKTIPDDPDIIYDYAMVAEKNGHYAVMEGQLRHLMVIQPENPQAYNALGYSLADRNQRLDEAGQLLDKASALAPTDAFIMDSLGWVKYRTGDKQTAIRLLQNAYKLQPNAEIGAHLGEVEWSLGNQDEARQTWKAALKLDPENDTLQQTLKRFQVTNL